MCFGPLALHGRRGPQVARAYQWAVLAVSLTAIGLVAFDPAGLWWLVPLALFAYACIVTGLRAPRRQVRLRLHGLGGSYIALVTALLVVSVEGPGSVVAWVLPTLVGLVLIERAVARARGPGLA